MIIKAWAWSPYALAGTFLIVQFWSGYLTGWVQRDLNEGRVKTGFWNIVSEFWLLIPLVLSGWGLSWGYYTTLFTL
ncbi:putative membrane protein [Escherichia coli MP021552.11]|nr:putative membrane protein [Escherichia coli MP021552.11]